jgi:hypothetical protein
MLLPLDLELGDAAGGEKKAVSVCLLTWGDRTTPLATVAPLAVQQLAVQAVCKRFNSSWCCRLGKALRSR